MRNLTARWSEALRAQLWPLPTMAVIAAVALGTGLPLLEAAGHGDLPPVVSELLFSGGPDAARSILQTVAGSLITVTSLTFSLTVVTLQLASSQFSPRLLRTFTSDRFVHVTLALFLAAFSYALTVLRSVRDSSPTEAGFVPEIAVTVAFVLTLASVIGLVLFLAHLTREIRVETMLRRVNHETQATITKVFPPERIFPEADLKAPGDALLISPHHSGFLTSTDTKALLHAAGKSGAIIRIDRAPGAFLVEGVPFATAWSAKPAATLSSEDHDQLNASVNGAVTTAFERTHVQDVGFGFRQLVDVAVRALSPGINDPTTAVHVIGHLSVLLCRAAGRNAGNQHFADEDGQLRVIQTQPTLEALLDISLTQPTHYGVADPMVAKRLLQLLQELSWCDKEGRYGMEIAAHLSRLREAINTGSLPEHERSKLLVFANTLASPSPPEA